MSLSWAGLGWAGRPCLPHVVHHPLVAAVHVDGAPQEACGAHMGAGAQGSSGEVAGRRAAHTAARGCGMQGSLVRRGISPSCLPHRLTCAGALEPHLVLAHRVAHAAVVALPRRRHGAVGAAQEVVAAALVAVLWDVACVCVGAGGRVPAWAAVVCVIEGACGSRPVCTASRAQLHGARHARRRPLPHPTPTLRPPFCVASTNSCMRCANSGGMPEAARSSGDRLRVGWGWGWGQRVGKGGCMRVVWVCGGGVAWAGWASG